MIIVSQDEDLIVNFNNIIGIQRDGKFIGGKFVDSDSVTFAEYKTEERAKEVMQEIIEEYKNCNSSFGREGYVKNRVYYMPADVIEDVIETYEDLPF